MHLNHHNFSNSNRRISHMPASAQGAADAGTTRNSPVLSRRELQRVVLEILG